MDQIRFAECILIMFEYCRSITEELRITVTIRSVIFCKNRVKCVFLHLLSVQRVNRIKLYKKDPNTVTGLLSKQTTQDNAGENTIKASVSIETGHCGHIEDLLKSLGSIIPCALRQTVPTLKEQQTTKMGEMELFTV